MRLYLIFLLFLLFVCSLSAQPDGYVVSGQVVDAASGEQMDYVTVMLYKKESRELISGTTTSDGGLFRLKTATKQIFLELSFIGYNKKQIDSINFQGPRANLGVIQLGEDTETLDEVVVRGEKSTTEFKLDKRVFNVGKDLSSTGASALEVLNNVPSVNVDIEGGITLRGSSGVQILINGKPSVLASEEGNALGTITAEMLEKVEVITNPSAKYEAEGTAGIINLVLKKNEKKGLTGSVTFNTGVPHNHSLGLSMSKRTEDFNLFTQLGVGYKELPTDRRSRSTDFNSNQILNSTGEQARNEIFYNLILGTDYFINKHNVITLSGSLAYEVEDQPSNFDFRLTDGEDTLMHQWKREESTDATNPKIQYELQYKRDFEDHKEHDLIFSAIGNYFGKDQSSVFTEAQVEGSGSITNQTTETKFEEGKYTFNLDYTKPFKKDWTLETGAQYVDNEVSNEYQVEDEINGEYIINSGLTNRFEYDQKVFGAYATGAYEAGRWGLKLGLRVENTDLHTRLAETDESNDQNFTNYFPSAHSSYKLSEQVSLQAGYSRRIYRPRLWDLNPFFNIRNNFSVRTGNPRLLPEYTDSYELGSIFVFEDFSFNLTGYYRYTTEVITRVVNFEENISVYMPMNLGTNDVTGLEFNFKYSPIRFLTFSGNANYSYFKRKGTFDQQVFDFDADEWSGKLKGKYKANKKLDLELTTHYLSRLKMIQGIRSAMLFADLGARYKLNKGKSVISLSVRDIFASRVRESTLTGPGFETYGRGQRGRFINLGYSYSFGKGEAMEFKGGYRGFGGGRRR